MYRRTPPFVQSRLCVQRTFLYSILLHTFDFIVSMIVFINDDNDNDNDDDDTTRLSVNCALDLLSTSLLCTCNFLQRHNITQRGHGLSYSENVDPCAVIE
jgi:hypothetical protein